MNKFFLFLALLAISFATKAQAPINNGCTNSSILLPNTVPQYDSFKIANATSSMTGCGDNKDVWFKFKMPATGGIRIRTQSYLISHSLYVRVYTGSCGALAVYSCTGNCDYYSGTNCRDGLLLKDSSLYGDTLYIRASKKYNFTTGDSAAIAIEHILDSEFNSNDTCGSAALLVPNLVVDMDTFTTENAIVELSSAYCRDDEDVWFKFKVPANGAFKIFQDKYKVSHDLYFRMYEGVCSSLTEYACTGTCSNYSTGNCASYVHVVDTSIAGDTILLRVSGKYNFTTKDSFAIGIEETPSSAILPNEDCANSSILMPHSSFQYDTFTFKNALSEMVTTCADQKDVWFKMKVPSSGAFDITTEKYLNEHGAVLQMFTGSCGSLLKYECDSNCNFLSGTNTCKERIFVRDTSLVNDTIYFRASNRYTFGNLDSFRIAVKEIVQSELPSYDDCLSASVVNVNQGGCVVDTFNNKNTSASILPANCANYTGGDAWFKFEMPSSDDVFIQMSQESNTTKDFRIVAYSGDCSSLAMEGCNSSGNYPSLSLRNLSLAGDSVFIMVYRNVYNIDGDTFGLCVKDTVLPPIRSIVGKYERITSCPTLTGSDWFDLIDTVGGLLMSVKPNGNYLGPACFGVNLEDSTTNIREENDTLSNTAFLAPRNFYITPQYKNRSALIRLYFKEREIKIWRDSLSARGHSVGPSLKEFYEDSLRITKMDGGSLTLFNGANQIQINPTVTKIRDSIIMAEFSVTSFSNFIPIFNPGNPTTPLPVSWLNFVGLANDRLVFLNWSTAQELNCSHFEVMRSYNGDDFKVVGIIEGHGTKLGISDYKYSELKGPKSVIYYKLNQIDFNGNNEFSKTIVIGSKEALKITPNPFSSKLMISAANKVIIFNVEIIDLQGRVVYSKKFHDSGLELNLDNVIEDGVYIIRMSTRNGVEKRRVVKSTY